jgi:hypothetical protein
MKKTKKLGSVKKTKKLGSVKKTKKLDTAQEFMPFGRYELDDCILFIVSADNEKQVIELQNTGKCVGVIRYDNPVKPSSEDKIFVVISR